MTKAKNKPMKRNISSLMGVLGSIFISTMVYTAAVNAQYTTNWVAINDHQRGTASSPYANFYNPLLNDAGLSGPLTNTVNYALLAQGAQTPASIIIKTNGGSVSANSMSGPNAGTPAGDWFRPYVDFGGSSRIAIQLNGTSTITYTFNGLDPSKRYIFKGTAARGNNYADRWTLATLEDVNSFTHAHRPTWAEAPTSPNFGVLTVNEVGTTNMTANQAAWNSGENRAAGAMIVFDNIDPGPDGSFSVTVQTYKGWVPGGSSGGSYGYAFSAFSVEEIIVSVNDPIEVTSAPTNQTILEGQTLNLSVVVLGSLPQFQWYKNGTAIPGATNRIYQVYPALPSDSGSYSVSVWNHINSTNVPAVDVVVVSEPLVVTNGLQNIDVFEASTVTLSLGISGTFPHYQWYKDGLPIEGATAATLTITNFSPTDAGTYMVSITNTTSQATSTANLTYVPDTIPPRIIAAVASTNYLTVNVTFSEPVSVEADDNWSYQIIPDVGDPIPPSSALRTTPTNVTLNFSAGDIQFGNHYTIVGIGITDVSRQLNPIDTTPVKVAMYYVNMLSIDDLTMWRFESRGYDYSNAWYKLDFDDTGWSNGAALFVSKEGTMPTLPATLRTFMNRSNVWGTARVATYYFRTWFDFTGNDPANSALAIRTVIDDGAIFYLNGKEVYRLGMPSGPVTSATYASRTVGDPAFEGPFTIILPGLVTGSNLIAVEVHDVNATSSDAAMGLEIMGVLPSLVPVEIVTPLSNTVINEGESLVLSINVRGASPNYQWYKDGVPIEGATSSFYPISNAKPSNSGVYKVVVSNPVNTVESSAVITVTPDTTPPAVISAVASTNLTTITITYSEMVDPFSSQDPGSYTIQPVGGGAAVDILNVVLMNGTNVYITTAPMQAGVLYSIRINGVSDVSESANTLLNYNQNILATDFIVPVWTDWKYENTGTDLGSNWFGVGFSDSTWQSGMALFGLESSTFVDNNPINTPLALTNSAGTVVPTYYFRKSFIFPYKTNGVKLAIMHAVDDGAIFYLNGVEIYRYNMPQGNVGFNTLASSSIDVSDYTVSPFIEVTNLVSGRNLIAVELHQGALTSSDVLFGAAILAQLPSYEVVYYEPTLDFTVQERNIIFRWSAPGFFLQQNSDLNTSNWVNVPNGNQSPATVPIGQGNMFFRLIK